MSEYKLPCGVLRVDFGWDFKYESYSLQIGSVIIPLASKGIAEKLLVETLEEKDIVWHCNENKGSCFFNDLYPEWSAVPHPRGWVAGNIYYNTRQSAMKRLASILTEKSDRLIVVAKEASQKLLSIKDNLD